MDNQKILIVEDNIQNAKLLEVYLKKQNIPTVTAGDGEEAFEIFKRENILAVLMDIQLPKLNGLDSTHKMQEFDKKRDKKTPIIAVTAYAKDEDKKKFLKEGLDDYIAKPISFNELNNILNKHISSLNLSWT